MKKIALFASGSGTNVVNIIGYFSKSHSIDVALVVCNKADAPVVQKAEKLGVPSKVITNAQANDGDFLIDILSSYSIDLVVLAGYLRKIPAGLTSAYSDKILNIHPSLLPKYGGKGMYGQKVHNAVIDNRESESGITIHLVNEEYDDGTVVFQTTTPISEADTAETLAKRIHQLEYAHFPKVIEEFLA